MCNNTDSLDWFSKQAVKNGEKIEFSRHFRIFFENKQPLKANVASEAAENLQMANNINANMDTNSQDSSTGSPTLDSAGGTGGSAALLLNHQTDSGSIDNIKSGNGSDNMADNETDTATADESSNGPIKVS